ncbi:MAG: metallophosphoesterase [Rhodospirillales bacterium]|nr:metallophosphoesterase [Rhodospirillales bacterium]
MSHAAHDRASRNNRVRILHLTDLHLRQAIPGTATKAERLSRAMPAALERLSAKLPALAADVVALTGDLLDVPDVEAGGLGGNDAPPSPALAQHAEADYRLMKDWLESTGLPYLVIPGNHDHEAIYDRVFGAPPAVRDLAGVRFVAFRDELDADRTPLRTGARRALFEEAVAGDGMDGPWQVHLQHYMIHPPTVAGWRYNYRGSRRMKRMIEQAGRVRAVLSGHYHPGSLTVSRDGVHYSVPPAFCSAPHPFRLMDVAADGTVSYQDVSVDGPAPAKERR